MKEFKTKRGKTIYLLNPSEKSQKYARLSTLTLQIFR